MLKFLFCCVLFVVLWLMAWPVALLTLVATPFIFLACLGLKALGFVVGGIIHIAAWVVAVVLAIALAVLCVPLVVIF